MLNPYFIPVCIFQFTLSIDGQPSLLFIVVARGGHCLIEMKQLGSSHSGNDLLLTCSVPMTLTRPLSRTKATLWWSLHLTPNFYQPYITTVWSFSDNQGLSSSSFFFVKKEQQLSFHNSNWWPTIGNFFPVVWVKSDMLNFIDSVTLKSKSHSFTLHHCLPCHQYMFLNFETS